MSGHKRKSILVDYRTPSGGKSCKNRVDTNITIMGCVEFDKRFLGWFRAQWQ